MRRKKKASEKGLERGVRMEDQRKNQLIDLNNHLFDQMERLSRDGLDENELQREIHRSKAVSNLAAQIINNARLALDATVAIKEGMLDMPPQMLGMAGYEGDEE